MMPVRPSTLSNRLIGVVTRLNSHVRSEPLVLPKAQVRGNELIYLLLALKISLRWRSKECFQAWLADAAW